MAQRTAPSVYGVITLAIEFAKAESVDGLVHPAEFERFCRLALAAYGKVEALAKADRA